MGKYIVDFIQSEIGFSAKLFNTDVTGTFGSYNIDLHCESLENLTKANVHIEIDAASLNTNESLRDKHLKSEDFLTRIYTRKSTLTKHRFNKLKMGITHLPAS